MSRCASPIWLLTGGVDSTGPPQTTGRRHIAARQYIFRRPACLGGVGRACVVVQPGVNLPICFAHPKRGVPRLMPEPPLHERPIKPVELVHILACHYHGTCWRASQRFHEIKELRPPAAARFGDMFNVRPCKGHVPILRPCTTICQRGECVYFLTVNCDCGIMVSEPNFEEPHENRTTDPNPATKS